MCSPSMASATDSPMRSEHGYVQRSDRAYTGRHPNQPALLLSGERDLMPKELFPSSYLCDCGHQSDFSENTIREAKALSRKQMIRLGDSAPDEHIIVFYKGEMVDIICPKQRPDPHASADSGPSTVHQVTVSTRGSIVIPAILRRRYGLAPGSVVNIEDRNGELVLSIRLSYKEARGILPAAPSLTVDLLAERARDREREEAIVRAGQTVTKERTDRSRGHSDGTL